MSSQLDQPGVGRGLAMLGLHVGIEPLDPDELQVEPNDTCPLSHSTHLPRTGLNGPSSSSGPARGIQSGWIYSPLLRLYSGHVPLPPSLAPGLHLLFQAVGWQVQFLEADLKTPLPSRLTFYEPERIRELARRGEAWGDSESRQMLEHAIETGRGGVYLRLTPEQYARLRQMTPSRQQRDGQRRSLERSTW